MAVARIGALADATRLYRRGLDLIGLGHDVTPALHAYAPSIDVRSALRDRLVARAGLAGVLVATRTHHLDAGELERRLARVRASLA